MLKRLLGFVFYDDYIPQAKHIIYPCLMMTAGYKCMLDYDWLAFGTTLFILGILLALVIIIGIGWRGPIAYWEQLERTLEVMRKIKEPAVWTAMGFKNVPETVIIQEKRFDDYGKFQGMSIKQLPVGPVEMNTLANTVLMAKSLDFTEEMYKSKVKNFRKVKEEFKTKDWIKPKNKNNVRGGYMFTRKGLQALYEYADASIIQLIEKEMKEGENDDKKE